MKINLIIVKKEIKMRIKKGFGKRLKEIRKARGLTQEELAELVNVAPRHISYIETARSFPSSELIERLSVALNVDCSLFFNFHDDMQRDEILGRLSKIAVNLDNQKLRFLLKMASEL